jgi:hypothetical protein
MGTESDASFANIGDGRSGADVGTGITVGSVEAILLDKDAGRW